MPPKSTSSQRSSAGGSTARNEWSTSRKTKAATHTSGERRGYNSYTPNYEAEADRRRSYTFALPGHGR